MSGATETGRSSSVLVLLEGALVALVVYAIPYAWILASKEGHATICVPISPRLFGLVAWGAVAGPAVAAAAAVATWAIAGTLARVLPVGGRRASVLASASVAVGMLASLDYVGEASERTEAHRAEGQAALASRAIAGDIAVFEEHHDVEDGTLQCDAVVELLTSSRPLDLNALVRIEPTALQCSGAPDALSPWLRRMVATEGMPALAERLAGRAELLNRLWPRSERGAEVAWLTPRDRVVLYDAVTRCADAAGSARRPPRQCDGAPTPAAATCRHLLVRLAMPNDAAWDVRPLAAPVERWRAEGDLAPAVAALGRFADRASLEPDLVAGEEVQRETARAVMRGLVADAEAPACASDVVRRVFRVEGARVLLEEGAEAYDRFGRWPDDDAATSSAAATRGAVGRWLAPLLDPEAAPTLAVVPPREIVRLGHALATLGASRAAESDVDVAEALLAVLGDPDPTCGSLATLPPFRNNPRRAQACATTLRVLVQPEFERCRDARGFVPPLTREHLAPWIAEVEQSRVADRVALADAARAWMAEHRPASIPLAERRATGPGR